MSQGAPRGALPEAGSIQEGRVVRIEPYGAFVDLTNFYRVRGLVHISQLANARVERVEDAVAVDDGVWVKVLSVTAETDGTGRVRHKVSLSIKDVSQDGACTDLGAQQEQQDRLKQQITQNLQSSIGMGVALDPMAPASGRKSNLILKHQPDRTQTLINGYALVDDDEPEPPPPAPAARSAAAQQQQQEPAKPMGRGRGTTLPAWMTRQGGDGPTKQEGNVEDGSSLDSRDRHRKKRKRHDKERKKHKSRKRDRKKHHKKHSSRHDRKHSKRSRRDRSYSRSRSRSRSVSSASSSPEPRKRRERSRSREARSRSPTRRSSRDNHREQRSHSRSRSPERSRRSRKDGERKRRRRSRSRSSSREGREPFQSVEDAQKLIEQLEAKKRRQEQK